MTLNDLKRIREQLDSFSPEERLAEYTAVKNDYLRNMNETQLTSLRLMREHLNSVSDEDFLADHNAAKDWGGVTVDDYLNGVPMYDPNTTANATKSPRLWEIKFPEQIPEQIARDIYHEHHGFVASSAITQPPYLENGYGDQLKYTRSTKFSEDPDTTGLYQTLSFLDKLKDKLNNE